MAELIVSGRHQRRPIAEWFANPVMVWGKPNAMWHIYRDGEKQLWMVTCNGNAWRRYDGPNGYAEAKAYYNRVAGRYERSDAENYAEQQRLARWNEQAGKDEAQP